MLLPHLVALEEYKEAALTRVLPSNWLESADNRPAPDSATQASVEPKPPPPEQAPSEEAPPVGEQQEVSSPRTSRHKPTSIAQAWIKQRFVPGSAPVAVNDILAIHKMVADQSGLDGGNAGALRTGWVQVGRLEVGGLHTGAPQDRLPALMEEFVRFLDDARQRKLPPVIHALIAHFFFDTLHPFLDANGRTSRLLAAAMLSQRGYNVHGTYALINYFYQHSFQYHVILHRAWKTLPFDVTQFVAFGIQGFVLELRSADTFIKMKRNRIVDRESSTQAFGGVGRRRRIFY